MKQGLVHPVLHVADGDVRVGAFARGHDLHGQPGIADAPPDQGGVEYQSFHKAVPGAAHDLVFLRLADAPGGVGAGVDGDTGVVPVDQQAGDAGEQLDDHIVVLFDQADLAVGNITLGEPVGVTGHVLLLYGAEHLEDFQQSLILRKAVYKVQAGRPPADVKGPVNHVEVVLHIQLFVEIIDIILQVR